MLIIAVLAALSILVRHDLHETIFGPIIPDAEDCEAQGRRPDCWRETRAAGSRSIGVP